MTSPRASNKRNRLATVTVAGSLRGTYTYNGQLFSRGGRLSGGESPRESK